MDSLLRIEAWRKVWRQGIVPQLTLGGLKGLLRALEQDSSRLITGATTSPPPLQCMANEPVRACCPLCLALLDGNQPHAISVGMLEERFAMACYDAPPALRHGVAPRELLEIKWTREEP